MGFLFNKSKKSKQENTEEYSETQEEVQGVNGAHLRIRTRELLPRRASSKREKLRQIQEEEPASPSILRPSTPEVVHKTSGDTIEVILDDPAIPLTYSESWDDEVSEAVKEERQLIRRDLFSDDDDDGVETVLQLVSEIPMDDPTVVSVPAPTEVPFDEVEEAVVGKFPVTIQEVKRKSPARSPLKKFKKVASAIFMHSKATQTSPPSEKNTPQSGRKQEETQKNEKHQTPQSNPAQTDAEIRTPQIVRQKGLETIATQTPGTRSVGTQQTPKSKTAQPRTVIHYVEEKKEESVSPVKDSEDLKQSSPAISPGLPPTSVTPEVQQASRQSPMETQRSLPQEVRDPPVRNQQTSPRRPNKRVITPPTMSTLSVSPDEQRAWDIKSRPFEKNGDPTISEARANQTVYSADHEGILVGCNMHTDLSKKLLEVFNCGDDVTLSSTRIFPYQPEEESSQRSKKSLTEIDLFYDSTCISAFQALAMQRPYYNETFATRFLRDITNIGIDVMWYKAPDPSDLFGDWSGFSATLRISPGSSYSGRKQHPTLEWVGRSGGQEISNKVALMKIHSISVSDDPLVEGDADQEDLIDGCMTKLEGKDAFFVMTTADGDVHLFEAPSAKERDLLITGLRNVIARLVFHVVTGDVHASSELYDDDVPDMTLGELPSLPDPVRTMNRLAHTLMD